MILIYGTIGIFYRLRSSFDNIEERIVRKFNLFFCTILFRLILMDYLFTWNLVQPSLKKALICLAAAIPAIDIGLWLALLPGVSAEKRKKECGACRLEKDSVHLQRRIT